MKRLLITIDGPAGAGKTTVSKILAGRLGCRYLDTGALYRGVAYEVQKRGISPEDHDTMRRLLETLEFSFRETPSGFRLFSRQTDISELIRTPEITMLASRVSADPDVRTALLGIQRTMADEDGLIAEGRDMGTVVFPQADIKFFLKASLKTRAMRRFKEFESKPGSGPIQSLGEVERDIALRDRNDSTRKTAPLVAAHDAITIDTSDLSVNQIVDSMMRLIACRQASVSGVSER
jgi:cytidylate kinase